MRFLKFFSVRISFSWECMVFPIPLKSGLITKAIKGMNSYGNKHLAGIF